MFVRIVDVLGSWLQPLQPLLWICAFLAIVYGAMLHMRWLLRQPTRKNALKHYLISCGIVVSIFGTEAIIDHITESSAIEDVRAFLKEPIGFFRSPDDVRGNEAVALPPSW